jgi:hypothetical protein
MKRCNHDKELIMATPDKQKEGQGRSFDQITHDGTGSAASVGTGGTGDLQEETGQSRQSGGAGRTDDLLSDGAADKGFRERESGPGASGKPGGGKAS